ncbi:MAG TPA: hypothetical protein VNZ61_08765 [Roseomonas sp.]|nr:hypothetical protein [Roseomonas sp.]
MHTSLRVIKAPAHLPVSVGDAARHCRLDAEEPELNTYLGAAISWAETWLGRALITQTLRVTYGGLQDPPVGVGFPGLTGRLAYPWTFGPQAWRRPLELTRSPVQKVCGVSILRADGQQVDLDVEQYDQAVSGEPATVTIRGATLPGPADQVSIDFVAGYGGTGNDVPLPIRQGILLLTAFLYEHRGDAGGDPPKAAEMLMWPYRLVTFGG